MTPTPEMIAMAERVAASTIPRCAHEVANRAAYNSALTAIMEVSEKAADYMGRFPIGCSADCRSLDHVGSAIDAIRNGEQLR